MPAQISTILDGYKVLASDAETHGADGHESMMDLGPRGVDRLAFGSALFRRRVVGRYPSDLTALDTHIAREANPKQRDRYRAARLALGGAAALRIADKIDRSRTIVPAWGCACRDAGGAHKLLQT